ncbi:amidohydrolase [Mycobacteroides chelonae]|uniref:amidohydrolase n=1 Tax=Mycobacteroides chelonae TaxID=1774 RepID=UPI0004AA847F|nr:amidohydrolase [Mycobacteroides chelonae]MBF9318882.1 amidohydrolase [Mycobacteroides chelonae]OHT70860.1 hypothetical protein BKG66_13710 [Mycobacteroides chelonae]OHT71786.1 hypothetical protein BKG67_14265 [Mycobacteroides chelonae]OHT85679.1 hypothetical protein BKG70_14415 [Mycobacteroides chelonae]
MARQADLIVSAKAVYPDPDVPGMDRRVFAVTNGYVVAAADSESELADLVGSATRRVDLSRHYVLPGFDDTHTHLMAAVESVGSVEPGDVRSIAALLDLLGGQVAKTPPGRWVVTGSHWQELNLAERRLPTRDELDSVSAIVPILVKRGGHNAVANSAALTIAGVCEDIGDVPGGRFGRDGDGRLDGRLLDNAVFAVTRAMPAVTEIERIAAMGVASRRYAASGITTVRDCFVPLGDLAFLRAARDAGELHVRVRALVGIAAMPSEVELGRVLTELAPWHSNSDVYLRVWGVKFVFDGGLEAGATCEHYAGRDDYFGFLTWDPSRLERAIEQVLAAGWRVGVHAYGDRAVGELLDIFGRVRARHPALPVGSLVIEHAGLATARQRHRAASLGVAVTVQHPLLYDAAHVQETYWGIERVERLFPVRSWVEAGVTVAAGSDYPVGMFGAMHSVWGLTTRQTIVGVCGEREAVDRHTAVALHTTGAARLLREEGLRGRLLPGYAADFTVWSVDPYRVPAQELKDLVPAQTWIGGRQCP